MVEKKLNMKKKGKKREEIFKHVNLGFIDSYCYL